MTKVLKLPNPLTYALSLPANTNTHLHTLTHSSTYTHTNINTHTDTHTHTHTLTHMNIGKRTGFSDFCHYENY